MQSAKFTEEGEDNELLSQFNLHLTLHRGYIAIFTFCSPPVIFFTTAPRKVEEKEERKHRRQYLLNKLNTVV